MHSLVYSDSNGKYKDESFPADDSSLFIEMQGGKKGGAK